MIIVSSRLEKTLWASRCFSREARDAVTKQFQIGDTVGSVPPPATSSLGVPAWWLYLARGVPPVLVVM